jgi:uncharacterized protein (DUF305 family)
MDIQSASVDMSQNRLQEQAAVQVQSMALDTVREQAAAVEKMIDTAQVVSDPNVGRDVNLTA